MAGTLACIGARHAAHDRRDKLIVACRLPAAGLADVSERSVGHDRARLVGDVVEHFDNMLAANFVEAEAADRRLYQADKGRLDIVEAPKFAVMPGAGNVTVEHVAKSLAFRLVAILYSPNAFALAVGRHLPEFLLHAPDKQ